MPDEDRRLHFNGLNGATGAPLLKPMTSGELVAWVEGSDENETKRAKLALRAVRDDRAQGKKLGVVYGINAGDIGQAGWGIVYHPHTPGEVKQKLAPLIARRNGRELGYEPGEDWVDFRTRHGQGFGDVDPSKLPYYLLLVGPPDQIPYSFQYGLDVDHAVGRLCFDTAAEYEQYVAALIAHEDSHDAPRERRLAIFAPLIQGDDSTFLSSTRLVEPLAKYFAAWPGPAGAYRIERIEREGATSAALIGLFGRRDHRPSLVFTASHGVGFPSGDREQRERQGAIVTQDWPGPTKWPVEKRLASSMTFAASDLPDADLRGLCVFAYGCYTAGTPRLEDFAHFQGRAPAELAPKPFSSRLAQRMLSRGAVAFIGHVERAWDYSFRWPELDSDTTTFRSALAAILSGEPIGHALEAFDSRYVSLAAQITALEQESQLTKYQKGELASPDTLVATWLAHNDARSYVLCGDPAARLRPQSMAEPS